MAASRKPRQHVARNLEDRFAPLFWLARNPPLPYPVRTDDERGELWERLDELDRVLERASLGRPHYRVTVAQRAAERKSPFMRELRLKARWDIASSAAAVEEMKDADDRLAWSVNIVRDHLVDGGWVWRKTGERLTDAAGQDHGEHMTPAGLLEALAEKKPGDPWRRGLLDWMQVNPVDVPTLKARLSIRGGSVELQPDPRDLHSCIWLLTAELVAGRWPIRHCAAPGCGKYIGQWTKRKRLFCDAGCRTTYHNARRSTVTKLATE